MLRSIPLTLAAVFFAALNAHAAPSALGEGVYHNVGSCQISCRTSPGVSEQTKKAVCFGNTLADRLYVKQMKSGLYVSLFEPTGDAGLDGSEIYQMGWKNSPSSSISNPNIILKKWNSYAELKEGSLRKGHHLELGKEGRIREDYGFLYEAQADGSIIMSVSNQSRGSNPEVDLSVSCQFAQ